MPKRSNDLVVYAAYYAPIFWPPQKDQIILLIDPESGDPVNHPYERRYLLINGKFVTYYRSRKKRIFSTELEARQFASDNNWSWGGFVSK